ncbi:MAG: hypothetical protein COU33_03940 [Candidatus Magasanikbacteria bacterium CG10_big_fil_rev_8_21_14_0_10_43_6]|uniref:EamA domain-containing protein n=1 Tax=Candidatus Magasanikbacteria bacterium CG10_big_fil_rev_8_21_14_0_10_43_6 TaxID=1974650 RepID=A0A2M6W0H3_9BACT|nr:MAG: hypothetical protein COU33_03940 [Candidatus Magasanikbacteria bacterium CG10_big_fil_rev_8_21_14_0_10_43_6]
MTEIVPISHFSFFKYSMWLITSLIGYFCLALVFVLDKFILTKSVPTSSVYTFYSTIFMFGALLAWPFGVELLHGIDWVWAVTSGVSFGFGLWAMYIALTYSETSHLSPFIGALITVFIYGLSSQFLAEALTGAQQAGIIILVFASFLLSFEKSRTGSGFHRGFLWGIVAALCFAISHVTAKYLYELYPFLTGFVWTRATTGLVGVILFASPAVWKTFKKKTPQQARHKAKTLGKRHAIGIVVSNKVLGVVGVVAIQYAIAIGSVTLVNAMVGIQFVLMFILIYLLTKFAPKVFQEYVTKRELAVQTIAIILVMVGSGLFVL